MKVLRRFLMMTIPFMFVACDMAADPENVGKATTCAIIDYQNGVYYFDCCKSHFGNALSKFLAQHNELELLAITGDGSGSHGADKGYFVVCRTVHR